MKKSILFSMLLMGAGAATGQTMGERLVGNWTVTQIAVDENDNKQLDKNEQVNAASLGLYFNLESNGTGEAHLDMFGAAGDKFSWSPENNGTELRFSGSGSARPLLMYSISAASNTMHVDKVSGSNLQLSTTAGKTVWITLKKK